MVEHSLSLMHVRLPKGRLLRKGIVKTGELEKAEDEARSHRHVRKS